MELTHEFRLAPPVEDAWAVLTDLERIAPCMPGATLEAVDGEEFLGRVKIKVGPLTVQYRGTDRMLERDEATRRAVARAGGHEARGQSNASATITAMIAPDPVGSAVTERGVLADVSAKFLVQFVERLESELAARTITSASAAEGPPPVRPAEASEPVDLLGTAGVPVAKRVLPVKALVLRFCWMVSRRRRQREHATTASAAPPSRFGVLGTSVNPADSQGLPEDNPAVAVSCEADIRVV